MSGRLTTKDILASREGVQEAREAVWTAKGKADDTARDFINQQARNLQKTYGWGATPNAVLASSGGLRWNIKQAKHRINPFDWGSDDRRRCDNLIAERLEAGREAKNALEECHNLDTKLFNLLPENERYRLFSIDWAGIEAKELKAEQHKQRMKDLYGEA